MIVDVVWDGVPLVKGATAREQDGGWFVELEQPMPVGTRIVLDGRSAGDRRGGAGPRRHRRGHAAAQGRRGRRRASERRAAGKRRADGRPREDEGSGDSGARPGVAADQAPRRRAK